MAFKLSVISTMQFVQMNSKAKDTVQGALGQDYVCDNNKGVKGSVF